MKDTLEDRNPYHSYSKHLLTQQVLEELGADGLPLITVWNKVDACAQPDMVWKLAANRPNTVALSAMTG